MNTSVPADTLLPREELVKLLCTADGKGAWAKMEQLTLLFRFIDDVGAKIDQLEGTWKAIKHVSEEKSQLIVDLMHDHDSWKLIAETYGRKLDELDKR